MARLIALWRAFPRLSARSALALLAGRISAPIPEYVPLHTAWDSAAWARWEHGE